MAPRAFLIGHPVAHSRSPLIHRHWLERLGIEGSYELLDMAPSGVAAFLERLPDSGFRGGNVTVPHKVAVMPHLAEVTPEARRVGAVNTVWIEGGRVHGDNTDCAGFAAGLDAAFGSGWADETGTALLIGAGGGARAVVAALLGRGVRRILVTNRSAGRAEALAEIDPARIRPVRPDELAGALGRADLLVNTTQLGMANQPALEIDLGRLPRTAAVADIVYVPLETPLLRSARMLGLKTCGGLGMLLHQAVPGFARWFGQVPAVTPELRALLEADVEAAA